MKQASTDKKNFWLLPIWLLQGIVVGFGAILPGVSGGTLCVAFGMYRPIIETLSNLKTGIKKHWLMLAVFFVGIALGFVGLSSLADWLMQINATFVTCVFAGFILGTIPGLWHEAGEQGRSHKSYGCLVASFIVMMALLVLLSLFQERDMMTISPNSVGFLLCGVLWGLSFIVPGLSSSSLLLFFGLYQPMLAGISELDFAVLIPIGIGMLLCILLLSKAIGFAYRTYYSVISHSVLGIVLATVVMILPRDWTSSAWQIIAQLVCILVGAVVSYGFTRMCDHINENNHH